ncbi:AAA family ATPase [bacterium]|nr:AAA family ATPase [bacterium]
MKIKKLELNNFRSFEHLEIDFSERLNVFVGVNGAGKTSILDSLAILLSRLIGRIQSSHSTGRQFTGTDIQIGTSETANTIDLTYKNKNISWTVTKAKRGRKRQTITNIVQIKKIVELVQNELENNEGASFPLGVYYAVNRAVLDIPLRIRNKHQFGQFEAYDQALTGKRNDFRLFFEWFRNREDLENEQRLYPEERQAGKKDKQSGLEYQDSQLQAVRDAIQALTDFSGIRIIRNPLRMEVRKNNKVLNVRHLSDGEKCLFALAGDLARRLAIANPVLDKPLEGSGVVLIDEIDLHLHPEWQHKVIPKLLQTFPNCQFIITTHSPQVLSHVSSKDIWCLVQKNGQTTAVRPEGTYGHDSNFLLKTLLGSEYRPVEINDNIQELFELIKKDQKAARTLLAKLKEKIEGASPDLIRAETLLHRREVLGR